MRVPIWIPRTFFGLLASVALGIGVFVTVATVFFAGRPLTEVPCNARDCFSSRTLEAGTALAAAAVLGSWLGTRLERARSLAKTATHDSTRQPPSVSSGQVVRPRDFAAEILRAPLPSRPSWVADATIDGDLRRFVEGLLTASWGDWQAIHIRVTAIPRPINIYEELRRTCGDGGADEAAAYANAAAVVVNRVVLDHYVELATSATDPRLAKTWIDILDRHDGPPAGALFQAVWALVLRRGLSVAARAQSGQAYARCVDPFLFDLFPSE